MSSHQQHSPHTALGMVERIARNDKAIVFSAVAGIVILASIYTVFGIGMTMSAYEMTQMAKPIGEPMQMGGNVVWSATYVALVIMMWWIMMIAMMTPSASPTLLLFVAMKRHGEDRQNASFYGLLFLVGYLLCWAIFSVVVTLAQWGFSETGVISTSMMTVNSKLFSGVILLVAGIYQISSLKNACLKHCRSPAYFLSENRRTGRRGAILMGAHHGIYCLGCCWALMVLLFVGGVMNLYWIIGLALYVLIEKTIPYGELVSKSFGIIMTGIGVYFIFFTLM